MMYLHPALQQTLPLTQQGFDYFMQLKGEVFRALDGRCTQRVILNGKYYFIKQHEGTGWKEIIKNILQFKFPILSAQNEWRAIQRLQALSVLTPSIMAYGRRGLNPARARSFLLMNELAPTVSLEDFCRHWKSHPPDFALKLALLRRVADIARTLHDHGINHRDFYICHFLLTMPVDLANLKLYLIDLHRAGIHRRLRHRWIIKDLAGLYFSSKDLGLSRHDFLRFMKAYHRQGLRDMMKSHLFLWQQVKKRGDKLYEALGFSHGA